MTLQNIEIAMSCLWRLPQTLPGYRAFTFKCLQKLYLKLEKLYYIETQSKKALKMQFVIASQYPGVGGTNGKGLRIYCSRSQPYLCCG